MIGYIPTKEMTTSQKNITKLNEKTIEKFGYVNNGGNGYYQYTKKINDRESYYLSIYSGFIEYTKWNYYTKEKTTLKLPKKLEKPSVELQGVLKEIV